MAQRIFFLADTHFGDEGILWYEKRPFETVEEMDEKIIENWNQTVKEEDQLFLLGDFSFYPEDQTREIGNRLKGKKTLILGNHDTMGIEFYRTCGFEQVISYPVIYDGFYILSHEPLYLNKNMPYANLFGHVHGNPIYSSCSGQSYCLCVERTGYIPIEFTQIKKEMKDRHNQ